MNDLEASWVGWNVLAKKKSSELGDQIRSTNRRLRRRNNQMTALEIIRSCGPALYTGEQHASLSNLVLTELVEKLKAGASNHDYRDRHNFLVKGLARGVRELNWDVEVPAYIRVYHPPKSPISAQGQRRGINYRKLLVLANESFSASEPKTDARKKRARRFETQDAEAGQLLFSAITRGGLLHGGWLTALPKAIGRGVWIEENGVSLELHMRDFVAHRSTISYSESKSVRRWFPDAITSIFLLRWYKKYRKAWPGSHHPTSFHNEELLEAYFCSVDSSDELDIPAVDRQHHALRISGWLLDHACREAALDYPGFLVDYASSLEAGASFPRETWNRLQTGLVVKDVGKSLPAAHNSGSTALVGGEDELLASKRGCIKNGHDHSQALKALRRCLSPRRQDQGVGRPSSSATAALKHFIESGQCTSPILNLVAQWLNASIKRNVLKQSKLKPASALRYLSTVGTPLLVASLDYPDIEGYEADDWVALYEDAIHCTLSTENKSTRRQRFGEFHHWLVTCYRVPAVDISEGSQSLRNVDANLLTPREYTRAKSWLGALENPRQRAICPLVLTIGFRCGLRRREVTHLRLQDLEGLMEPGFNKPTLRVMNQRGMTQKSPSAVRRLPIWLLLLEEEKNELKRWVQTRIGELGGYRPNALLFSMEGRPSESITDRYVFKSVTRAMIAASGDITLRFHHNRHSFATFTGLRMLESYPGQFLPDHWVMGDSGEALMPHWGEDFSHLASLGSASSPTQKHLWELCTWCGHLTPGETMSSYSHLFDWLLGQYLAERRNPELSLVQQAQLVGVSATGIDKFRSRRHLRGAHRAGDILAALADRWKPFALNVEPRTRVLPTVPAFEHYDGQSATSASPLVLYELLQNLQKLFDRDSDPYGKIADTYALPEPLVREWAFRAELLSQAETYKKTPILRFYRTLDRKPRVLPESRPDHAPSSDIFIAPPRERDLRARSEQLFKRLVEFFEKDPDLVLGMLASSLKAFQRTKVALKFQDLEDSRKFLTILDSVGLKSRTFVHLRLAPGMDEQRAKTHWGDVFGVDKSRIKVKRGPKDQERPFHLGWAHPDFFADKTGLRSTWTVVKFVLAAAIIMLPPIEMTGGVLQKD